MNDIYMTIQEASKAWDITERRIQVLCSEGRITGAKKFGRQWAIPANSPKPDDARIRTGRFIHNSNPAARGRAINRPKIFSFFSGSGFLDLGFENQNFNIVFANEYYTPFMYAYEYSREKMEIPEPQYGYYNGDINDFLTTEKKQVLHQEISESKADGSLIGFIGGPPCPDFSIAGKNKGREGDNGKLSQSYISLIIEMRPDFFLFENVKGLWKTARHRAFFEELKGQLHNAGYITTERLTNALEYGAPQDRDRILMFGIQGKYINNDQNKLNNEFPWRRYQNYRLDEVKALPWPITNPFSENTHTDCPIGIPEELTIEYWFQKNEVESHPNSIDYFKPRAGIARMQTVMEGDVSRKSYKRPHRWRYSPTAAYGNNEVHLHPYKPRRLSAAEALAIQTLPPEFQLPQDMSLSDKFKTIGNGVPYVLASGIAHSIHDYLTLIQAHQSDNK